MTSIVRNCRRPVVAPLGRLLGARDISVYIGVTESKARKLIRRGEIVVVRNHRGRLVGAYEADLDRWQQQRRTAPARQPGQVAVDERMKALMPQKRAFG